jgi:hypothetical protein
MVACVVATVVSLLVVENGARAASRTLCEQTVSFNIETPAADSGSDVRAYSGVWLGRWAKQARCMAVIVENVGRDGVAKLRVVFGALPGYGQNAGAAGSGALNFRWTGTIRRGVMEIRFDNGSTVTLKASTPDQLDANAQWVPSGFESAVLRREP